MTVVRPIGATCCNVPRDRFEPLYGRHWDRSYHTFHGNLVTWKKGTLLEHCSDINNGIRTYFTRTEKEEEKEIFHLFSECINL